MIDVLLIGGAVVAVLLVTFRGILFDTGAIKAAKKAVAASSALPIRRFAEAKSADNRGTPEPPPP